MLVTLLSVCALSTLFVASAAGGAAEAKMVPTTIGMRPSDCIHFAEEADVELHSVKGKGVWAWYPKSGRKVFHAQLPHCVENAKQLVEAQRAQRAQQNKAEAEAEEDTDKKKTSWKNKVKNAFHKAEDKLKQVWSSSDIGESGLTVWQDYAYYSTLPETMGIFSGNYIVSQDPQLSNGELLYFFLGMQNDGQADVTIIQPVVSFCTVTGGCDAGQGS